MKIIITGKTGLIGSAIFNNLINNNHQIISIGRNNCDYYADLNNLNIDISNLSGDVFIHCAGVTDEEIKINRGQAILRNTIGLINLVDFSMKIGISKFIYVSSAHVYGSLNQLINEQSNTEPKSIYGVLHLFAEKYIKTVFKNFLFLRPGAVYGETPSEFNRWELIPFSFPRDLAINEKIIIRSHGKQWRNFISSNTIAEIIIECIEKSISGVINPVGFYSMSVSGFAKFCIKTINKRKTNNSMLNIELLGQGEYENKFKYISTLDLPKEDENLLKDHIYNLYKKIYEKN